jgi:hypothetical protein
LNLYLYIYIIIAFIFTGDDGDTTANEDDDNEISSISMTGIHDNLLGAGEEENYHTHGPYSKVYIYLSFEFLSTCLSVYL